MASSTNDEVSAQDILAVAETSKEAADPGTAETSEETTEHIEVPAEEESVLASLGINGQLFAIQLLNFAVVIAILWFLVFKPLIGKMEERRKLVEQGLDDADDAKKQLELSDKKSEVILQKANRQANKIVEDAKDQADDNTKDSVDHARAEVAKVVVQGKKVIEEEREKMMDQVKEDLVDIVVQTSEKVLGKAADAKVDQAWVKEQLN